MKRCYECFGCHARVFLERENFADQLQDLPRCEKDGYQMMPADRPRGAWGLLRFLIDHANTSPTDAISRVDMMALAAKSDVDEARFEQVIAWMIGMGYIEPVTVAVTGWKLTSEGASAMRPKKLSGSEG